MANNLISDVMKMATPAIVERLAATFGVNANVVRNILASAVPAIFAGLANQASTPSGLNNILASLGQADPNIAGSLGAALSEGANNPLVAAGTGMLQQLLGDGALSAIVNSVTKNAGASAAAGGSLVAIAGQMAMSALAKQAGGMDATGLGNLLSSQASLFQSSLPASLANALGNAGVAGAGAAGKAAASATTAARSAATTTTAAGSVATAPSGSSSWLMWLIPVVIVAAALWWFLGHRQAPTTMEATPPAQSTTTATPPATAAGITIDNVDVSKTLGDSFGQFTAALGGVTDAASAQTAAAKIQDAAKGIGTISGLAAKFTPEQKAAVAALVNAALPALKDAVTKAEAMTGAGDVLKPVIDPLVGQLEALAKT